MTKLLLVAFLAMLAGPIAWLHDLSEAQKLARADHKLILLNFSGSDWCGPCIRMHKEIFERNDFGRFADSALVMVNADFPRMKKDQLPTRQQDLNNAMADKYDPGGKFPFTVLMTGEGKVLKEWTGFPDEGPEPFIQEIRNVINSGR